jgi:xylitol oxidase
MAETAAELRNWSGNFAYSTPNVHHPETVEQVQALVKSLSKLRVLGTRHCFNTIADSTDNLLMLDRLPRTIQVDRERKQACISGNVTYGELCPALYREGFALHNLASLAHISVAGACATATHGSGVRNQTLAAAVAGLEIVTASGDLLTLSRGDERFEGAVVHLGGLGVVVALTLDLLPTFEVSQHVYEKLPQGEVEAHFDEIMSSAYSVSLFTTWQEGVVDQVWLKRHTGEAAGQQGNFFGAQPATKPMHPIAEMSAENCTGQLGVAGAWHERLPHFRIDALPSAGNELQTEYFVPRSRAVEVFRALISIRDVFTPHLMVSEIRTVAADNLWMSPYYHRDTVGFHFTWKQDVPNVMQTLPLIEAQLAPFGARPHWGKLFTVAPQQVRAAYEKLSPFQALLREYDPEGKFRNAFLDNILSG